MRWFCNLLILKFQFVFFIFILKNIANFKCLRNKPNFIAENGIKLETIKCSKFGMLAMFNAVSFDLLDKVIKISKAALTVTGEGFTSLKIYLKKEKTNIINKTFPNTNNKNKNQSCFLSPPNPHNNIRPHRNGSNVNLDQLIVFQLSNICNFLSIHRN